jgi:alkylated DNA repair protein (DNA oxidative demethylase)
MTFDQAELFESGSLLAARPEPGISGLELAPAFLSVEEEIALIARIDAEPLTPFKFQQWEGKRLTASFGWSYDFTTGRIGTAAPFPDWLLPIRDRAAAFAGVQPDDLVQALLIRYDAGAGIGWHKDRPVFEHVLGISLGNRTTMRFRRRKPEGFDRAKVQLAPRSIYHLTGEVRHQWEHSIAPMDLPRWSITLRSLA